MERSTNPVADGQRRALGFMLDALGRRARGGTAWPRDFVLSGKRGFGPEPQHGMRKRLKLGLEDLVR